MESSLVSIGFGRSVDHAAPSRSSLAGAGSTEDSYFASSAALLEKLADEPEDISAEQTRSSFWSRMMTPGGVGASMLLLLGSATAGYLILHPRQPESSSVRGPVPPNRWQARNSSGSAAGQSEAAARSTGFEPEGICRFDPQQFGFPEFK
ncbi:MAG: hypothetical protein HC857_03730 [Synechococcales cyanobacterium RU_4_20]|nr:hypothetical protein [Synechococcales cyanobacterium RU_4_20]